jgi:hypothetical protein
MMTKSPVDVEEKTIFSVSQRPRRRGAPLLTGPLGTMRASTHKSFENERRFRTNFGYYYSAQIIQDLIECVLEVWSMPSANPKPPAIMGNPWIGKVKTIWHH